MRWERGRFAAVWNHTPGKSVKTGIAARGFVKRDASSVQCPWPGIPAFRSGVTLWFTFQPKQCTYVT
jgi:hypothetical protein